MTRFNSDIEFVHGSGQVTAPTGDLTFRTDDLAIPRSVIIGSGAILRPERDAINRLGTPGLRWYDGWIGDLHSLSGILGGPTQTFSWTVGGFGFNAANVSFSSATVELVTNSTLAIEAASELNSDGTIRFNDGSQFEMSTLMEPQVDNVGIIGQTAKRYSHVHASSGIFNELSPQASGTFISVDASLIPLDDAVYSLGVPELPGGEGSPIPGIRWSNIVAASGRFNSIYASTSGASPGHTGAYIELGASLIPPAHPGDSALFWIGGGKFNQMAGVRAVSGLFTTVTMTTATIATLTNTTLTTSLININTNGDFINGGAFDWDLGGAQTLVGNGDWVFDTDATLSATTGTITTATIPTLGSTTITAGTINSTAALNAFGTFGTLGLATFNGGTFFGNAAAPSANSITPFGLEGFKWGTIYSVSGIIDSLLPATSGGTMMMHGHIDPGNDSVFDLGTTAHRWGAVHAVSGVFDSGVRSDQGLAEYQLATGSGTFAGATWVDLEWDTNVVEDTEFYTRSAGIITINRAGLYRVSYGINTGSVGTGRATATSRVWLNGTTLVGGSVTFVYSRTTGDDEGTSTKSFLVNLSATDTLVVQSSQEDGSSHDFSFLDECNVNLEFMRD
tara:strand:+ start:3186 stop:5045 length:1860 start_codon:yes stop_codon:yes gene_type:complete